MMLKATNAEAAMSARQPALSTIMIYLSFAATGTCMALPGAVLPALLARWSLADSQAGLLFFLAWAGTSVGALMVRPPVTRALLAGHGMLSVAAFGMAYVATLAPRSAFAWMTLFGLGLGMIMTATSLLQATRQSHRRGAELNRLNLAWAMGASLCPTLAEHSLRVADVHSIFAAVGVFFLVQFAWVAARERDSDPSPDATSPSAQRWSFALWPLSLVLVIFLPTGIEASMGAWIAAYVQRTQHTIATTVTAGTCFWMGLMVSRTLSAILLKSGTSLASGRRWFLKERVVLRQSLGTVVFGILLLILSRSSLGVLPGVFLIGFGLGPVYPLLLSIALQYSQSSLIFFVAGLGSACLPCLTGVVSSATGSLRTALFIPLAASALMLALGILQASRAAYYGPPPGSKSSPMPELSKI